MDIYQAIKDGKYEPDGFPRFLNNKDRQEFAEQLRACRNQFKNDALQYAQLTNHPKANLAFDMAWDIGWSAYGNGYTNGRYAAVAHILQDLANLMLPTNKTENDYYYKEACDEAYDEGFRDGKKVIK